ncbi:hypothetical protein [Anaeromyxobacter sp. PSR-1]|uniref:DUF6932 family protein n=1 Tax=Anaeromyxobacter sp. PSR-1 TaxID=1300915 RepID=UPI000751A217|nr:hypothetical protein [Anaeromyxobacter sp. PSR-1]
MPIPEFDAEGKLPPGIHDAGWAEFSARYGLTGHRRKLLKGLRAALVSLKSAGCKTVYVDGSFVTEKQHPKDFDACWEEAGVDPTRLDPVLLDFDNSRARQKATFYGELFPASFLADIKSPFLEFFQTTFDGHAKGIVRLDLTRWQP